MKLDRQKDYTFPGNSFQFKPTHVLEINTDRNSSMVYLKYYWVSGEGGWMFDLKDSFQQGI